MEAYLGEGALYCEACRTDDMDGYPDGGGEADSPHHCDACGTFLENPLTPDGEAYVRQQMTAGGRPGVLAEWREFYSYLFEGS